MTGSDDTSARLNISIHKSKHPKTFEAIHYFKEKGDVLSNKFCEGLVKLYEDEKKGEKLESYYPGGMHQTTLPEIAPSPFSPEEWRYEKNAALWHALTHEEVETLHLLYLVLKDGYDKEMTRRREDQQYAKNYSNFESRQTYRKRIETDAEKQRRDFIERKYKEREQQQERYEIRREQKEKEEQALQRIQSDEA